MRQTTPCPACPNPDCQQPHVVRTGHMSGQHRSHCLGCGAWCGQTEGTPLDRLRTPPDELARALLLVRRRGSLRAAAAGTGHTDETIGPGRPRAARHAEALTPVLVHDWPLSPWQSTRSGPSSAAGRRRDRRRSALGWGGHRSAGASGSGRRGRSRAGRTALGLSGARPRQPLRRGACPRAARGGTGHAGVCADHAALRWAGAALVARRVAALCRAAAAHVAPAGPHGATGASPAALARRDPPHTDDQAPR
jgi:hypothetical protein